ncbi:hypothetical protein EG328_001042 [Venturia inaequalis]|uniref:Protein HRI1 n=1 Tax=Venturia inaequalis TaxID=5025 RepID=A0A8H3V183_VENIN|nr:hypothetical protein EG328_001042 [Venturia inaequalis]RDI88899.1 hypothetical protein Vi05172_g1049 [Venturia inaequalis]
MPQFKGHVSHRASIRWLPDPASEPTSTLVLTSSSGWFIDVRILSSRETPPPSLEVDDDELLRPSTDETSRTMSMERMDWAFSGSSKSTSGGKNKPRHSEWTHWVDSKTLYHEPPIVDAGDMYPVSKTRDLEKGSMPNPATGIDTEYEEVWDDMPIDVPEKSATCSTFLTEDEEKEMKGCIVKLGSWCQGVLRVGKEISAERWKFLVEEKSWVLVARVGEKSIGCEIAFGDDKSLEVGETIEAEGREWTVKEVDWSIKSRELEESN